MLHQHMLRLKSQSCHTCKCCHQPSSSTSSPKLPKAVRPDMIYAWRCKHVGIIQLLVREYRVPLQCWSWAMRWHAHVDGHGLSPTCWLHVLRMHHQPACIMRTCMSYCPAGPALTSTLCRRHPSVLCDAIADGNKLPPAPLRRTGETQVEPVVLNWSSATCANLAHH